MSISSIKSECAQLIGDISKTLISCKDLSGNPKDLYSAKNISVPLVLLAKIKISLANSHYYRAHVLLHAIDQPIRPFVSPQLVQGAIISTGLDPLKLVQGAIISTGLDLLKDRVNTLMHSADHEMEALVQAVSTLHPEPPQTTSSVEITEDPSQKVNPLHTPPNVVESRKRKVPVTVIYDERTHVKKSKQLPPKDLI